jgi:hypothetical protein
MTLHLIALLVVIDLQAKIQVTVAFSANGFPSNQIYESIKLE